MALFMIALIYFFYWCMIPKSISRLFWNTEVKQKKILFKKKAISVPVWWEWCGFFSSDTANLEISAEDKETESSKYSSEDKPWEDQGKLGSSLKNLQSHKNLEDWHCHFLFTNKAEKGISYGKKSVKAEPCPGMVQPPWDPALSSSSPSEAFRDRELDPFPLWEAPGAFIATLNHYFKSHLSLAPGIGELMLWTPVMKAVTPLGWSWMTVWEQPRYLGVLWPR